MTRAPAIFAVSFQPTVPAAAAAGARSEIAATTPTTRNTPPGKHTNVNERLEPGDFDQLVQEALDALPPELRRRMSNVAVVVEDEPPAGQPLLGLYQGVPLTRRSGGYVGALPDKITIFRGPLERIAAFDPERLRREVERVVLHEVAHHFGIGDERLVELDRY